MRFSPEQDTARKGLIMSLRPFLGDGLIKASEEVLLSTREVALLFRVSTATVRRWANSGALVSERSLGGHRRFPISGVRDALRLAGMLGTQERHAGRLP